MTDRPTLVWRSFALRLVLAAVPLWVTTAVFIYNTPWRMKLLAGSVLLTTLVSPVHGLLAAVAIAPLGQLLSTLLALDHVRVTEMVVITFLAGWLLRAAEDRPGPRMIGTVGWLLALSVATSVAVQWWRVERFPNEPHDTFDLLAHAYYLMADRVGFIDGARLLEGLALAAAVVTLFRQRPALSVQLPAVLAASATVAAVAALLLWRGIAPMEILRRNALIGYRVSAHVGDVNAAASYFALILCGVLGMAFRSGGRARFGWLAAASACAVGLWLSESRSAFGAVALALALAGTWSIASRAGRRWRAPAIAAVLVIVIAGGLVQLRRLSANPEYRSGEFRQAFNTTSLRMIAAYPLSGVGVGQYYRMSPVFLSPQLAWSYGYENAHNYFLQTAAELGLPGCALLALVLGWGLFRAGRALALGTQPDLRLLGLAAGVAAFLATCLTGHPLLLDEVAFPFWLQFGLMVGLAGSALPDERREARDATPRARPTAALIAACGVALAPIGAFGRTWLPPEATAVNGLYEWEKDADGVRYRWSGGYASVLVPADVTRVYIPVRMPAVVTGLSPMGVEARTTASGGVRVMVGSEWAFINVELPDVLPPERVKRVNLKIDRTWQPALYIAGNADLRSVGVQVGECRLFRER